MECLKSGTDIVRLWLHESERVYRDKLVTAHDLEMYDKQVKDVAKKVFEDLDEVCIKPSPLIISKNHINFKMKIVTKIIS